MVTTMDTEMFRRLIDECEAEKASYQEQRDELDEQIRNLDFMIGKIKEKGGFVSADTPGGANRRNFLQNVEKLKIGGMTKVDALRVLLGSTDEPLDTDTLLETLETGGLNVGGEDVTKKKKNLYTLLHRTKGIKRIGRGLWTLSD